MTVLHDFNKFWEMMRRERGSKRPPLTEAQKQGEAAGVASRLPHAPDHRAQGAVRNPGYSMRINELPQKESDEMLEFLFEHQTKPEYRYASRWHERDVLMWDNIGTIHNAVADYGPDEHRLIKRCQVMATRFAPWSRHALVLLFGFLSFAGYASDAQEFPSKPIRFVVGFAAGGPTDVIARIVAQDMTASLGQGVVVENRTGANALIATEVARRRADGYTLLVTSLSHNVNAILLPERSRTTRSRISRRSASSALLPLVLVTKAATRRSTRCRS